MEERAFQGYDTAVKCSQQNLILAKVDIGTQCMQGIYLAEQVIVGLSGLAVQDGYSMRCGTYQETAVGQLGKACYVVFGKT